MLIFNDCIEHSSLPLSLVYLQCHYCEETADVASQTAVSLQPLEPYADPESSMHDASQYAAVYQALDPKTLE